MGIEPSFWDHFDELRRRLLICIYVFFVGFLALYFVSDHILDFIRKPLFDVLPEGKRQLYYTGLFENFLVHLKVSACAAIVLLSPVFFFILWGFVAPGLKQNEIKVVRPFLFFGAFFFMAGAAFAYYVLLPSGIRYFLAYGSAAEVPLLTLDSYVSLILKLLLGFGACFELPVIIVLAAKLGFLNAEQLSSHRRIALIVITVVSALVAPPDAFSMIMLMIPLYLLYESAVFFVKRAESKAAATKNSASS